MRAATSGQPAPGQDVVNSRVVEVTGAEYHPRGGHAERAEDLRGPAAAELAGQQAAEDHRADHGQRGPQPQADQRGAEQAKRDARDQRGQDGLVDVAGLQVPGADDEVQLVAVEAVAVGQGHQQGEHGDGHQIHDPAQRLERTRLVQRGARPGRSCYRRGLVVAPVRFLGGHRSRL